MVEIKDLSKRFNDNIVLDGLDLKIEKGDVIGVIGPSGTGKSTLLRCINLLVRPDRGYITIDGRAPIDLAKAGRKEAIFLRQYTGMVFQNFNLFERKSALENVMEGLITVKKMDKEQARKKAFMQLENVGLSAWANYYPKHLSGGQQQRVAIARALAMEPDLLLLDEPTSALDPELVGEVLQTIKAAAAQGYTMILVSHEMNFVRNVSERVIFLDGGKVLEDGTPGQVFGHPEHERVKEFLTKMDLAKDEQETP